MEIYANERDFMYDNANKQSSWARLLRFNFMSYRLPPTLSAIAHWGPNVMFITEWQDGMCWQQSLYIQPMQGYTVVNYYACGKLHLQVHKYPCYSALISVVKFSEMSAHETSE